MSQPGIEVRDLYSHVLGQELQLYLKLPWTYDQGDKVYPLLVSLDANRAFALYSTMSLIFEAPAESTTELLIAGVGYKLDLDRRRGLAQWLAWRTRDLTPVRRADMDEYWMKQVAAVLPDSDIVIETGGAARFLEALQDEVIPYIAANYRVAPGDRGLAGYSYGGLFSLYALFHAPALFTRYFAGSPPIWPQLFEYEERYGRAHSDLRAKLLITAGGAESDRLVPIQRLAERLRSRGYPGLEVLTHVFEDEGHRSAYAASVSRALCTLYSEAWRNG